MDKKSQAAIEYLFLVGILLVAVLIIFIYASQQTEISLRTAQTREAVKTIAEAADSIYKMGGGKTYVYVTIPDGIENYSIANKTILLKVRIDDQYSDAFEITIGNVTGKLPTKPGIYKVSVEMLANGTILILGEDIYPPVVIGTQPSGRIPAINPSLRVFTDEDATCKFCISLSCDANTDYATMQYTMTGSGTSHNYTVGPLSEGGYLYYTRCNDTAGNVMTSSATIEFIVDLSAPDTTKPEVWNTVTNASEVFVNEYVCMNANARDNALDNVWALITDPNGIQSSYSMNNSECNSGGDVFGVSVRLGTVGNYTVNTTFANDTSGNLGWDSPYPNIKIRVLGAPPCENITGNCTLGNETWCRQTYPCIGPTDIGLDEVFYFKTDGSGFNTTDTAMKSWVNITSAMLDDTLTTPTQYVVTAGNTYEGYVAKIYNESTSFSLIWLYVRVSVVDVSPFTIRVYAYKSGTAINETSYQDFIITSDILNRKVKWIDLDVTNLTRSERGLGWTKLRITSLNLTAQSNKRLQFSEIHFKVG